jgi:hypothetical protein
MESVVEEKFRSGRNSNVPETSFKRSLLHADGFLKVLFCELTPFISQSAMIVFSLLPGLVPIVHL